MIRVAENIVAGSAIVIVLLTGVVQASDADKDKAAISAAQKWIDLVDADKYAESWKEAAVSFKSLIPEEKWQNTLQQAHRSLGNAFIRKVKAGADLSNLPRAPGGDLFVVRFETTFQNMKESAVETVTLVPDKNGRWRVSGYFITPGLDYRNILLALPLLFVVIGAWLMELKPKLRLFNRDR